MTNEILQSLGCGDRPVIPVLNKWDLVGDADSALHLTGAVRISALKNEGIPALLQAIEDNLPVKPVDVTALLPFAKTGIAAQLKKRARSSPKNTCRKRPLFMPVWSRAKWR